MSYPGTRSCSEAVMPVLTEGEYASKRRATGMRVIQHRGRWWEEQAQGFYQAMHWMARQRQDQAERPTALCWGFRTTLDEEDLAFANGWLPVHLLSELASYDLDALPGKVRNKLRKCKRLNEIVQVTAPPLLRDQGYEVRCSVTARIAFWKPPSKEKYARDLDDYIGAPYRLVLAGLSKGTLSGYLDGVAVDGTAYINRVYVHTNALSTEVCTGLVFEFVQACRRSGLVREIAYGLDAPSDQNLKHYKVKMGFPVVRIPMHFWLLPPSGAFIRWWRPEVYYRMSGIGR